ncbi:MAG: hypothetical protein ACXW1B_05655 [Nitrososphaeraceae archaeon]
MMSVISGNQLVNLVYAQSDNGSNPTNIDTEINNLLNKVGRGNIIDSTIESLMQGMGSPPSSNSSVSSSSPLSSLLPPSSSSSSSSPPNKSSLSNTSNVVKSEIMSLLKNQDSTESSVTINQVKNQNMKYFAKIVDKNSNNEDIISSNSLTEFNNELLKFCLESGTDYYSCSSIIQDSVQSAQFTSTYMGPATVNTDLIGYSLELKIK